MQHWVKWVVPHFLLKLPFEWCISNFRNIPMSNTMESFNFHGISWCTLTPDSTDMRLLKYPCCVRELDFRSMIGPKFWLGLILLVKLLFNDSTEMQVLEFFEIEGCCLALWQTKYENMNTWDMCIFIFGSMFCVGQSSKWANARRWWCWWRWFSYITKRFFFL